MRLAKTLGTSARTAERFGETSHELVDLELRSQLAGRWRMATMQIVFSVIPALVYLAAGLPATAADDHRHARGVHRAAGRHLSGR